MLAIILEPKSFDVKIHIPWLFCASLPGAYLVFMVDLSRTHQHYVAGMLGQ